MTPPASAPRFSLRRPAFTGVVAAALVAVVGTSALVGQERLSFIGVALDVATRDADRRLIEHVFQKSDIRFAQEELEYERMIHRLVNWKSGDGLFLARTTPYVYVVAEMLGANVEPLATYVSAATSRTTYHAYLVVPRKRFPVPPSLGDVVRFIREHRTPARFVFHSQFSTSSFFLPLLFFRSNRIFHMPESTESLSAVTSTLAVDASSSKLVELVARGDAEIAAVWDGTKNAYERASPGAADVYFVQLPEAIPNDLLVCSGGLDEKRKVRITEAIQSMEPAEINVGDFLTWKGIGEATEARLALANLRWLARERQAPVTVDIAVARGAPPGVTTRLMEAARQAVRLSGTELVLFDGDYHEHIDFAWTLEAVHDGAVVFVSTIPGLDVAPQTFRLSFRDTEDLSRRLVSIVQSRMHRIRYVWPFSGNTPMVMRDIPFALPRDARLTVQSVTWIDPERNSFRAGPVFTAGVRDANYYRYELELADFVRAGGQPSLNPMGNAGYRVILRRPEEQRALFRVLTLVLVVLFTLAGLAALLDLLRHRRSWVTPPEPL
jgi:ABC-type phosphate/phosphonate transport system substrate-binding protein